MFLTVFFCIYFPVKMRHATQFYKWLDLDDTWQIHAIPEHGIPVLLLPGSYHAGKIRHFKPSLVFAHALCNTRKGGKYPVKKCPKDVIASRFISTFVTT